MNLFELVTRLSNLGLEEVNVVVEKPKETEPAIARLSFYHEGTKHGIIVQDYEFVDLAVQTLACTIEYQFDLH